MASPCYLHPDWLTKFLLGAYRSCCGLHPAHIILHSHTTLTAAPTSIGSIPSLWQASWYSLGSGLRIPSLQDCSTTSKWLLRNLSTWSVWSLVSSIQLLVIAHVLKPLRKMKQRMNDFGIVRQIKRKERDIAR